MTLSDSCAQPPAACRAAAFGPDPGAWLGPRADASAGDCWETAVALGGQGRYAAATAVLERLLADPRVPQAVAAHAAVTLASHRRQLGGYAVGRRHDSLGLRLATTALEHGRAWPDADGTDAAAARVDALVGLAADAVGLGAVAAADRVLATAEEARRDHPSWRLTVRAGWVAAELALAAGRAVAAVGPAQRAADAAHRSGSVRHLIKSRIVLAVARSAAGADPNSAIADLDDAAEAAARLGLLPLRWPALLAAADLLDRGAATTRHPGDGALGANDSGRREANKAVSGTSADAARRRHAAAATLSVIASRSDPVGRHLMRVSMRPLGGIPGTVTTPFGPSSPT